MLSAFFRTFLFANQIN